MSATPLPFRTPSVAAERREPTSRHIQAVKLMLPKIPDKTSLTARA